MTGGLYEIKNWIAKDYFEPCWNVDPLWNILNKSFDKKSLIISLKVCQLPLSFEFELNCFSFFFIHRLKIQVG